MKVKIGIDIDNVLAESYPAYLSKFNSQFGVEIQMEEIREFYFLDKYIKDNKKGKVREMVNFIDGLMLDVEFQTGILPIPDSIEIIKKWSNQGIQIHYITARPVSIRKMTEVWLKKHGYWVNEAKLDLYNFNKHSNDTDFKKEVADKNNINIFIEDALEIAMGMDIPVFLLDRPWNRGKLKKNIIRVYSWKEIEEKLPRVLNGVGGKN
ncbi:hypothetical protein A2W14_04305 [Candidatus Gottesmanbacteria bacterium RBG_16_37_8]|uniref:Nucleotidase n=1 Tax=Candidatus Gottesmanbacteria bacterium RBG_16_37_8 TaxID=1798371 RepID=A0A1F5YSA1_9BACT|nr:MAG: hypothetical protein A2W14_04305 [Candidatus Gottesmanbacteria bacterium RBG_16_37_8]